MTTTGRRLPAPLTAQGRHRARPGGHGRRSDLDKSQRNCPGVGRLAEPDRGGGGHGDLQPTHPVVDSAFVEASGEHTFGSTLHVAPTMEFAPSPEKVEFQWLRNGIEIPFATGSSYLVTAADVDQNVSVRGDGVQSGGCCRQRRVH